MEIVYFVAVVAVIAIVVGFISHVINYLVNSCRDYKRKHAQEEPKDDVEFVPADFYSQKLADDCISSNDYRFDTNRRDIFISASSDNGELGELWSKLMCINFNEHPKKLSHDVEEWFLQNIDKFYKYGETLAFIEHYPLLEDLFLENLELPDQNIELQKRLISVCIAGSWRVNYINLLIKYLCKWDLLPEIKAIVYCDYRFERVKNIYDLYRRAKGN